MSADLLSNEELLNLQDDHSTSVGPEQPQLPDKPRRRYHKLTDDLLLGPRGLPTLKKALDKYKFKSKKPKSQMTSYERYMSEKYDHSVHFENLTRLLHIYQLWGHEIYPKYKFKDFIPVLSRATDTIAVKEYRRGLIRKEVDDKLAMEGEIMDRPELDDETRGAIPSSSAAVDNAVPTSSSLFVGDDETEPPLYTLANEYKHQDISEDQQLLNDVEKDIQRAAAETSHLIKEKTADDHDESEEKKEGDDNESDSNDSDILGSILSDSEEEKEEDEEGTSFLAQSNVADTETLERDEDTMDKDGKMPAKKTKTQAEVEDDDDDQDQYADSLMREMGL
ncbi:DEKNAAC100464 [Brettanomyces naardenensis]|uniref:Chromosome segregation in meiosis protein n=1 Tax=Brettanomyces naardenensis TaxID=13370 RepID=A0A448YF33_BRENA|nr:DEKNAAC100464 [Brettanomyces naardenensis]